MLRPLLNTVTLALCISNALASPTTQASTPTVNLGYATYQGVLVQDPITNQTNTNFLGVRYATAPTGNLRFRAPRSPAVTSGVQLANAQPAACLAAGIGLASTTPFRATTSGLATRDDAQPSEDCLFLNVFVPGSNLNKKKKLPVLVWIHGGGYVAGSAAEYPGNDLLRESDNGVIVVILQYRLGLFGFLPGQKVKDGGDLNAGLLDQQFALKWIQEHICKFGGDAKKVTIWGESAGAGSVMQHLLANGGQTNPPLFRAAMTSSTYLPSQYRFNDRIPETLYSTVVSQSNCSSAQNTLQCLRVTDITTLQNANLNVNGMGFFGTFVFVPVVDGTFITERPTELLRQLKLNAKVVLGVTNAFEGTLFVDPSTTNVSNYISQLFPNLDAASVAGATAQYADLGSPAFQVGAIMGESIFICPTYYLLRAFGQNGFKGELAVPPATHGQDIGFYFPSNNPGGISSFPNPAFEKAFSQSFVNFALSVNPNTKFDATNITPLWKAWSEGASEMLFNKTAGDLPDVRLISTPNALLERCKFWESVSGQTAQ